MKTDMMSQWLAREVCRLREELHEKNKELQRRERLAALGEMAAGVAHEIRNPLGGIGLYASLLERDLADRPRQRDLVRKLSVGIRNLESIVGDILAFAGGSGRLVRDSNLAPAVSLAKIIRGALSRTAPQAAALHIELELDGGLLEPVELFCDPGQIERALVNLILNALEAAGVGGRVWIRRDAGADAGARFQDAGVRFQDAGARFQSRTSKTGNGSRRSDTSSKLPVAPSVNGLLRIAVEDNGPGIAPELLQRVFDPFFTTKDSGTGLGLAIVHRIVESSGGFVSAGHRDGGGASFVLSLPLGCEGHDGDTIHRQARRECRGGDKQGVSVERRCE